MATYTFSGKYDSGILINANIEQAKRIINNTRKPPVFSELTEIKEETVNGKKVRTTTKIDTKKLISIVGTVNGKVLYMMRK